MATSPGQQQLFQISVPPENRTITLNVKGQGTITYTVHNLTNRELTGRALLNPEDPLVKERQITVQGETDKPFKANGDQQFTVKIDLGLKSATVKQGTLSMRFVDAQYTDFGDIAPAVAWKMPDKPITQPPKLLPIILALIALVVIGGGVTAWLVLRNKTPKIVQVNVPNVRGMTIQEATDALQKAKLKPGSVTTVLTDADSANVVLKQSPNPDTSQAQDSPVDLQLGVASVVVPMLVGHNFQEVNTLLSNAGLTIGNSTNAVSTTFGPGIISGQNPTSGARAKAGDKIDITIAKKVVSVPPLVGVSVGQARQLLANADLKVGDIYGLCGLTLPVTAMEPGIGTSVDAGTAVTLHTAGPQTKCPPLYLIDTTYFKIKGTLLRR